MHTVVKRRDKPALRTTMSQGIHIHIQRRDLARAHCKIYLRNSLQRRDRDRPFYCRARDCATRECEWAIRLSLRCTHCASLACYVRHGSAIGGAISRLIQMFARYSRRSDASIGHHSPAGDKCVYDVSALPHLPVLGHDTARGGENRRSPRCREGGRGFYKGRYCGTACRPSDRGEYRLLAATADKPNVSHSFVSKSDRKQAAGCHLAPLSSLSRAPNIPRFDELAIFRSLRQQHVHLGQIEKDPTNTRNSKLIRRGD